MIKVTFDSNKWEVTIKGHANAGEEGHDLVCAAASILFYTLAATLEVSPFMLKGGKVHKTVRKGSSSVRAIPKKDYEGNVGLIFFAILNGFDLLCNDYPENITLETIG